jgi:hypothetical protein
LSAALLSKDSLIGIVNQVFNAAPPALFKACCPILGAAQSLLIPIVNGPTTDALCANKWCQHVLFQQAKVLSPRTMAYWNSNGTCLAVRPSTFLAWIVPFDVQIEIKS